MALLSRFFIPVINRTMPGHNVKFDIAYGDMANQKYDEYPLEDENAPLVIFWHGGGWKTGRKANYRFIGHRLQSMGAHAFVVDYPKFPNRVYPGFTEDAKAAVDHIKARYPNRKLILIGHSAGAHTALMLGLAKKKIADKVVAISAPCHIGASYKPIFGNNLEKGLIDPRNYAQEANKQTEFLLIHGGLDFIVPVTDSVSLNKKLKSSDIKSQLILISFMEHVLILPLLFFGPLFISRHKLKKFIVG